MKRRSETSRRPTARRIESDLVQLSVYLAEPQPGDRGAGVHQLVSRAAAHGSAGSTVLAASGGFGRRHIHRPTFWHRADETPLVVVFIDRQEVIDAIRTAVGSIFPDAFVTLRPVRTIRYTSEL